MLGIVKKMFFVAMTFFSFNSSNINSLECVSMNNQECKTRTKIININNNEPVFYPFSIKVNKCSGSCNNVNNPYAKLCVPDVVKNINVKVFNLMPRSNQTKHIELQKTCKCKCRSNSSVCINKQRWNESKCRCECRELVNKKRCDKEFFWNPSKNSKNIEENEMIYNETLDVSLNVYKKVGNCTLCIVLFSVFSVKNTVISTVFIYFY